MISFVLEKPRICQRLAVALIAPRDLQRASIVVVSMIDSFLPLRPAAASDSDADSDSLYLSMMACSHPAHVR
jgi:hypothetical protein